MFRTLSIIVFLVPFAGIVLRQIALVYRSAGYPWRYDDVLKKLTYLLTLLLLQQRPSLLGRLKKLAYVLACICFLVLAFTGFYPPLVLGRHLSGHFPMVHVTVGGVFAVCLAILVLSWAHQHRFNESDLHKLQNFVRRKPDEDLAAWKFCVGQKTAFWLIALLALPLMLSIVLSMFPLFGMEGQHFLAEVHRYSALAFASVGIVHTYLTVQAQKRQ
jgi:cytochrome b subunit of formate dehydrogenase